MLRVYLGKKKGVLGRCFPTSIFIKKVQYFGLIMKVDAGDGHGLGWKFAKCSQLGFLATTMLSSRYCCPIGELQPSAIDSAQSSYLSNLHSPWAEHQNSRRNTLAPFRTAQFFSWHRPVLCANICSWKSIILGEKIFPGRKKFFDAKTSQIFWKFDNS